MSGAYKPYIHRVSWYQYSKNVGAHILGSENLLAIVFETDVYDRHSHQEIYL